MTHITPTPHTRFASTGAQGSSRSIRAFTLIELLVVVAIIALLISILLPALSQARAITRQTKCMATMRSFGQASVMYSQQNGNWTVPWYYNPDMSGDSEDIRWMWFSMPDFRSDIGLTPNGFDEYDRFNWNTFHFPKEYICPDATASLTRPVMPNDGSPRTAELSEPVYWVKGSYGISFEDMLSAKAPAAAVAAREPWVGFWSDEFAGWRESMIADLSGKLMFADSLDYQIGKYQMHSADPRLHRDPRFAYEVFGELSAFYPGEPGAGNTYWSIAYRHNGRANVAFFDGHAEAVHKIELWENDYMWDVLDVIDTPQQTHRRPGT